MHRRTIKQIFVIATIALCICCGDGQASTDAPVQKMRPVRRIRIYETRQSATDLEVTGLITALSTGTIGYVHYSDLLSLPQQTFQLHGDETFPELRPGQKVNLSGVYLNDVAKAIGARPKADLIDATCVDNYRSHFPSGYVATHRPVLVLTVDRLPISAWAQKFDQASLGPYFIAYAHFIPTFKVLSHTDQPQLPTNILRLNFSTAVATFGSIAPKGNFAPDSPEQQGFAIARQNCLRCHNQGQYGGDKSGRTWTDLGAWAREQPAYFANYVHDPQAFDPKATMPANKRYDAPTLAAITAYFRTFADTSSTKPNP